MGANGIAPPLMLALDTDVLVAWSMDGAPHHADVRILVEGELARRRGRIVIAPRVLEEFLHVVTDSRRFEEPFTMKAAIAFAESILATRDVVRLAQQASAAPRMLELLSQHRLGRKRILDTALAATLEAGGVRRLATFNGADFAVFDFLEIVDPRRD